MKSGNLIEKDTICRVISDNAGFFKPGDIVITLDTSEVPLCTFYTFTDFSVRLYVHPLMDTELEVLYDRTKK